LTYYGDGSFFFTHGVIPPKVFQRFARFLFLREFCIHVSFGAGPEPPLCSQDSYFWLLDRVPSCPSAVFWRPWFRTLAHPAGSLPSEGFFRVRSLLFGCPAASVFFATGPVRCWENPTKKTTPQKTKTLLRHRYVWGCFERLGPPFCSPAAFLCVSLRSRSPFIR